MVLLHEPSLGEKRRPPNVSTVARTGDDVSVRFDFDRTYNGLRLHGYLYML
jgi:hypothetical protein